MVLGDYRSPEIRLETHSYSYIMADIRGYELGMWHPSEDGLGYASLWLNQLSIYVRTESP